MSKQRLLQLNRTYCSN